MILQAEPETVPAGDDSGGGNATNKKSNL